MPGWGRWVGECESLTAPVVILCKWFDLELQMKPPYDEGPDSMQMMCTQSLEGHLSVMLAIAATVDGIELFCVDERLKMRILKGKLVV